MGFNSGFKGLRTYSCSGAGGNGGINPCILTFGTRCQDADQSNYTPVPLYFQHEEHKSSREKTQTLGKENGTAIDIWGFGMQ